MNDLFSDHFEQQAKRVDENAPLAERARPKNLDEFFGQEHLTGSGKPLRIMFEKGEFPSMIFWGPPGVGKTTLAYLIAGAGNYEFTRISAVEAGVKEVRDIISNAQKLLTRGRKTLLFIDEIHRFNKSQQDALLHAVEKGIIKLIGATTENPSFEVNSALLSRSQVYRLKELEPEHIEKVISYVLKHDIVLSKLDIEIADWDFLNRIAGGDGRSALNALELAVMFASNENNDKITVTSELLETAVQQKNLKYDKKGESHYDTISAFIKSMRGSDPDAAMIWLVKMLDSGEDPKFIARRMVIFASEDIGNADPRALEIAVSVFNAVNLIGMPECAINLAQGVTYLASASKSNSSYFALKNAQSELSNHDNAGVPLHLRNAPTKLMKAEGYAKDYKYPHSFPGHFINENYFPISWEQSVLYKPSNEGEEQSIRMRLKNLWSKRYLDMDHK